jgi:serine protease Do
MALTFDTLHATMMRFPHDSVFTMLRTMPNVFRADTTMVRFRPAEIATGTFTFGMRAVAGAELHDIKPELGAHFGVQRGVLVLDAREGTPAARAGLRGGDVIVRANGAEIGSITELRRAIDATRSGTPVQLRVLRSGQNVDITLNRN